MTVNGYDVVRMVRNLREPDVTPKTAARAADLMDELAEELAGTREELGDLNSLLDAVMNESITCEEVLHLARHLHACMDEVVKSLQLLAAGADGVVLPAGSAGAFRTLADYIEWPPSMAATKAGITLRRAADQIAPTAEPDLTTVEGWNEVARRWLADGPPPGWRGHTDRLEVANPVARWLSLDPELVRLAARVGGAL